MARSPLIRALSAPARFFRYLNEPGVEAKARYDALPDDQKAERRLWSSKLYGYYAVFPSPFSGRRKPPPQ
jgi:hypothetical protein